MNTWTWPHVVVAVALIGAITFLAWDKVVTGGQAIGAFGVLLGVAATSVGVGVGANAMARYPGPPHQEG